MDGSHTRGESFRRYTDCQSDGTGVTPQATWCHAVWTWEWRLQKNNTLIVPQIKKKKKYNIPILHCFAFGITRNQHLFITLMQKKLHKMSISGPNQSNNGFRIIWRNGAIPSFSVSLHIGSSSSGSFGIAWWNRIKLQTYPTFAIVRVTKKNPKNLKFITFGPIVTQSLSGIHLLEVRACVQSGLCPFIRKIHLRTWTTEAQYKVQYNSGHSVCVGYDWNIIRF